MNRKTKISIAILATLSALLFIQAFVFPVIDMAVFYILFTIEQHSELKRCWMERSPRRGKFAWGALAEALW